MDKTVKNVLAVVGAVALVKAAPVLAAGVAIGTVVANPEKARKAVEDVVGKVEDLAARAEAAVDEELARFYEEDDCECCCGGKCDCEGECCCDTEDETEPVPEEAGEPAEAPTSWEDEVPVEEEPAPEVESEPAPTMEDKLESLQTAAEALIAAAKSLVE